MKYLLNAAFCVVLGFIFIGCVPPPITEDELEANAISQDSNYPYFSNVKKGEARIIFYRKFIFMGGGVANSMLLRYEDSLEFSGISRNANDYQNLGKMGNNGFIITDVKANKRVTFRRWAGLDWESPQNFSFIPENGKIYCVYIKEIRDIDIMDKQACIEGFDELYNDGKGNKTPIKLIGAEANTAIKLENNKKKESSKCFGAGC